MAERYPPGDITPALADFRALYDEDDNWFWTISCGHHLNLFDAACEEIDRLTAHLAECGERFDTEHEHVLNLTDEVARLRAQLMGGDVLPSARVQAQHEVFTRQLLLGNEDG